MPCSCGRTLDMTRLEAGAKKRDMPDTADDQGGQLSGVRRVGRDHGGEPAEPDGLQEQTRGDDRAAADPVGQIAGDGRDEHRHPGPGQHPQPRLGGRVAEHALHVLAEQEDRAEHPEEHQQAGRVDPGEGPVAEEPHRQHRVLGADAVEHEAGEQSGTGEQPQQDDPVGPADDGRPDQPVHDPEEAAAGQQGAADVERGAGAERLRRGAAGRAAAGRGPAERSARRSTARRCAR